MASQPPAEARSALPSPVFDELSKGTKNVQTCVTDSVILDAQPNMMNSIMLIRKPARNPMGILSSQCTALLFKSLKSQDQLSLLFKSLKSQDQLLETELKVCPLLRKLPQTWLSTLVMKFLEVRPKLELICHSHS